MNKNIEHLIEKSEICRKIKICRKNLSSSLVITEPPKTPFYRINFDILEIPTKNYIYISEDELTKFTILYIYIIT